MKLLILLLILFSTSLFAQDYNKMTYNQLDSVHKYYNNKKLYIQAIPYLEAGIVRAKKEGIDSIYSDFTNDLGYVYFKKNNFDKALELYQEALKINKKIYSEADEKIIVNLNDIAQMYDYIKKPKESEEVFLEAIAIQKKHGLTETVNYISSLDGLATIYFEQKKYDLSVALFVECSNILKKTKGDKHLDYITILFRLSSAYTINGEHEESEALLKKVGTIVKEVLGENHVRYLNYLINLANLYVASNQYELSESLFLEALEICRKNNDLGQEYAAYLRKLSIVYYYMEKYEEAKEAILESTEIIKELFGEENLSYLPSLDVLAAVYMELGENEKAEKLYIKCISTEEKLRGSLTRRLAMYYTNYGNFLKNTFNYKKAEELYLKAIRIDSIIFGENNISEVKYYNLAKLYQLMNRYEDSKAYYYKAILRNCKDTSLTIAILEKDLEVLIEKKNYSAEVLFSALEGIYMVTKTQFDSSGIKDRSNLEYGYSALQVAMEINKKQRNELSENVKLRLLKEVSSLAARAIDRASLLSEEEGDKYIQEAFSYAELNKSALLADAIKGDKARIMGDLPDSLILYELELDNNKKNLEKEELSAKTDSAKTVVYQKQNNLNEDIKDFLKEIKDKYPKYHALKYENITAKASEIQGLLTEKTMMLEYLIAESVVYLFALTPKELKLYKINLSKAELNKAVGTFRNLLSNYKLLLGKKDLAYDAYNKQAAWFYEKLIKVALENSKVENLIIIADGELGHLPFEAFLIEKGAEQKVNYQNLKYLVKDYNISYNYSATLWKENIESIPLKNNKQILAYGGAYEPNNIDSSLTELREPYTFGLRTSLSPLPQVVKEVEALEAVFKGTFRTSLAANERTFKQEAAAYEVIHLAMHGILNPRAAILSSLAFTENQDSLEDNFLQAHEISKLKLNANLVVLSACETGYGKFEQGEGVLSLARSFMYAGVPSLIVSLWQVNDGSTAMIMTYFYENLTDGMPKDEALRRAKLRYIEKAEGIAAHPAFWSPFIQLGDSRPILIQRKGADLAWWLLGLGGLFLAAGVFMFWRKRSAKR